MIRDFYSFDDDDDDDDNTHYYYTIKRSHSGNREFTRGECFLLSVYGLKDVGDRFTRQTVHKLQQWVKWANLRRHLPS